MRSLPVAITALGLAVAAGCTRTTRTVLVVPEARSEGGPSTAATLGVPPGLREMPGRDAQRRRRARAALRTGFGDDQHGPRGSGAPRRDGEAERGNGNGQRSHADPRCRRRSQHVKPSPNRQTCRAVGGFLLLWPYVGFL